MITGRISGTSVSTRKGQMGGELKTVVNNFAVKNMVKVNMKSLGTEVSVKMGATGTLCVEAKRDGKRVFFQNI